MSRHDEPTRPDPVELQVKRLNGVVREAYLPPLAAPVTHGSPADLPFDSAERAPRDVVLSRRDEDGRRRDVTAAEFAAEVQAVAKGLIAEGLVPGDRLAVMARTRYEWTLLDFAAWAAGLVTVPIHPTASVFQACWILQDSGAVALVTESAAQAAALGPELERIPDLRHLWVMDKGHVDRPAEVGGQQPDAEVTVRRGVLGPDTLATIVYTSGTTGRPKGCALTHGNFFAEVDNGIELLQVSRPESIRRFAVLQEDFTESAGHLTPSLKLRRAEMERDFAGVIEGLYGGRERDRH